MINIVPYPIWWPVLIISLSLLLLLVYLIIEIKSKHSYIIGLIIILNAFIGVLILGFGFILQSAISFAFHSGISGIHILFYQLFFNYNYAFIINDFISGLLPGIVTSIVASRGQSLTDKIRMTIIAAFITLTLFDFIHHFINPPIGFYNSLISYNLFFSVFCNISGGILGGIIISICISYIDSFFIIEHNNIKLLINSSNIYIGLKYILFSILLLLGIYFFIIYPIPSHFNLKLYNWEQISFSYGYDYPNYNTLKENDFIEFPISSTQFTITGNNTFISIDCNSINKKKYNIGIGNISLINGKENIFYDKDICPGNIEMSGKFLHLMIMSQQAKINNDLILFIPRHKNIDLSKDSNLIFNSPSHILEKYRLKNNNVLKMQIKKPLKKLILLSKSNISILPTAPGISYNNNKSINWQYGYIYDIFINNLLLTNIINNYHENEIPIINFGTKKNLNNILLTIKANIEYIEFVNPLYNLPLANYPNIMIEKIYIYSPIGNINIAGNSFPLEKNSSLYIGGTNFKIINNSDGVIEISGYSNKLTINLNAHTLSSWQYLPGPVQAALITAFAGLLGLFFYPTKKYRG